jgi:signal transduction histidine kinase
MSHELRTPMHAILSFSRLGIDARHGAAIVDQARPAYLGAHRPERQPAAGLLNDLLDLSKLESGKMRYDFAITTCRHRRGTVVRRTGRDARREGGPAS